jgi:hypothetical protein
MPPPVPPPDGSGGNKRNAAVSPSSSPPPVLSDPCCCYEQQASAAATAVVVDADDNVVGGANRLDLLQQQQQQQSQGGRSPPPPLLHRAVSLYLFDSASNRLLISRNQANVRCEVYFVSICLRSILALCMHASIYCLGVFGGVQFYLCCQHNKFRRKTPMLRAPPHRRTSSARLFLATKNKRRTDNNWVQFLIVRRCLHCHRTHCLSFCLSALHTRATK